MDKQHLPCHPHPFVMNTYWVEGLSGIHTFLMNGVAALPFLKKDNEAYRLMGLVGSFGFTTAGAVAGGYFLGSYLDRKFNTSPWLVLTFMVLGVIGSFIEFFKLVKKLSGEK